ncbi:MAG: hypothetical protein ACYSUF_13135 [Planctomycetota bacterium]
MQLIHRIDGRHRDQHEQTGPVHDPLKGDGVGPLGEPAVDLVEHVVVAKRRVR